MSFVETPPVPFNSPLYGGNVTDGMLISISGVPNENASWFAINLQCGANTNPRDDIAYHLSARFNGDAAQLVRNSLHGGQWGVEETFGHFPFRQGEPFELLIHCDDDSFNLAVNGEHYCEFAYRMPMHLANTLVIDGDVTIWAIRTEGGQVGVLPIDAYAPEEQQEIMCVQSAAPGYANAPPMGGGGGPIGFNLPGGEEAYTQQVVGGEEGWFSRNKSPNKPPPEVGHKDSSGIPNWVKYTAGGVAAVGVAAVGAYALKKLVYPSKKGGKSPKGHGMKGAMGSALADKFLSGNRGGGGGVPGMANFSDHKKAKKDKKGKKDKKEKKNKKDKKHKKHSRSSSSSSGSGSD